MHAAIIYLHFKRGISIARSTVLKTAVRTSWHHSFRRMDRLGRRRLSRECHGTGFGEVRRIHDHRRSLIIAKIMTRRMMMIIMTGPQILHLQLEFATPLLGADRLRLPGFDRCILDLVTARGRLIGKGQTLGRSHDGCRVAGRLIRRVFGTGKQGSKGLGQMVFDGG